MMARTEEMVEGIGIPDSLMRMEALQAAVATSHEGEAMQDFMQRVMEIYAFLTSKKVERSASQQVN